MSNAVHNSIMRCLIEEGERREFGVTVQVSPSNYSNKDFRAYITDNRDQMLKDPINGVEYLIAYGDTVADAISQLEIFLQRWY